MTDTIDFGRPVIVKDCITNRLMVLREGKLEPAETVGLSSAVDDSWLYVGPGLVDLQVNGVAGVDFNGEGLEPDDVLEATRYLISRGVTTYLPAVITNSEANMCSALQTIDAACRKYPLVAGSVGGVHLEGPFISFQEGYRGAHPVEYIREADWDLFSRLMDASGNRIRIVAVSPEGKNSIGFIKKCDAAGVIVTIAHSGADDVTIGLAVGAGVVMTSHLGNGVPVNLRRHPNVLWDLLAAEGLYASIITDGYHIPPSFIKVAMSCKPGRILLVSDTTCFAGMQPGIYKSHIGGEVELEKGGRLSFSGGGGLLAGAAKTLDENVGYLVSNGLSDLSRAWSMASVIPSAILWTGYEWNRGNGDFVVFDFRKGRITVHGTWKGGANVWNGVN